RSNGDSVTQTAGLVTLVEGAPVILNCTYQTSYLVSFLFWYVQYLDKAPQLLLKSATESQRTESQGFHATLVKKENSFPLQKPAVQPSDSAVYYCTVEGTPWQNTGKMKPSGISCSDTEASKHSVIVHLLSEAQARPSDLDLRQNRAHSLTGEASNMQVPCLLRAVIASMWLGSSMSQKVTQDEAAISMLEKEAVTLNCVYNSTSFSYYLFWYKQPPSGEMILLIDQESYREEKVTEGRFSLNLQKPVSSFSFTISALELQDSAVYFCALRESTVKQVPAGALQNPQISTPGLPQR
ncbi:Hypothetical predicted protein, partial [Marmota monax]